MTTRPNSIDGGEPLVAAADEGGYVQTPALSRARPADPQLAEQHQLGQDTLPEMNSRTEQKGA